MKKKVKDVTVSEILEFCSSRVWIDRDAILEKINKEKEALDFSLNSIPMCVPLYETGRVYIKGKINSLKWVENQLIKYGKDDDK